MDHFKLVSPYCASGDQPEAISALAKGVELGMKTLTYEVNLSTLRME